MNLALKQAHTDVDRKPGVSPLRPLVAPRGMETILSLEDLEPAARPYLPRALFEFISGGVERNASRAANLDAFQDIWLKPRALHDVTGRSMSASVFGQTFDAPFGIAPMGAAAMAGYRADLAMARAAGEANIPFILSGSSLIRLEDVIEANPSAWFQAYVFPNFDEVGGLIDRVWNAGYRTLVFTIDVPVPGNRENNIRAGMSYPLRPSRQLTLDALAHPKWLLRCWLRTWFKSGMPHFENASAERGAPILSATATRSHVRDGLDWDDFDFMRERWKGQFVVKGILDPTDAKIARERGADGIIVSNHGGRQLDGAISPLKVLPEIVKQAGGMTVMYDSGIRRGTDVIKALALGARFVFVGRPMLYAAALGGQPGVSHAIALLAQEISRDMALLGCNGLSELESRIVVGQ